jgi:hypothetical protein
MDAYDGDHELELTFDQLVLVHKSLQVVRTLGVLPPGDELLDDTLQRVDQALDRALRPAVASNRGHRAAFHGQRRGRRAARA